MHSKMGFDKIERYNFSTKPLMHVTPFQTKTKKRKKNNETHILPWIIGLGKLYKNVHTEILIAKGLDINYNNFIEPFKKSSASQN